MTQPEQASGAPPQITSRLGFIVGAWRIVYTEQTHGAFELWALDSSAFGTFRTLHDALAYATTH